MPSSECVQSSEDRELVCLDARSSQLFSYISLEERLLWWGCGNSHEDTSYIGPYPLNSGAWVNDKGTNMKVYCLELGTAQGRELGRIEEEELP